MKILLFILLVIIIAASTPSCKKDTFITSKDAFVSLSDDTLHFDTVFTTTGSVTQSFKIFNNNNQKLLLNNVQLMGGANSYFKFNFDGTPGTNFSNVEIAANDSIYGFVTVSINPTSATLPFIIQDSIQITYNGNTVYLQLDAYGQNAHFLQNATITKDTTWDKTLPFVILGGLTINNGATLSILKGTNIYVHANAPIIVNGTLNATGTSDSGSQVKFQGDRLDYPYNGYPSSWPGITFSSSSIRNTMQYCVIKNAYDGVIVDSPSTDGSTKLTLNQCIFDNIYDVAIGGIYTTINATSCLVSNSGYNVSLVSGGTYNFNQCTIASYANSYVDHKNPVITLSNTNASNFTNPLTCTIQNTILYGSGGIVDDEVALASVGNNTTNFTVNLYHVLYKETNASNIALATLDNGCINYNAALEATTPIFDSTDAGNRVFNFHLKTGSPAIATATTTGPLNVPFTNLDGHPFLNPPNIGCY